MHCLFLDTLQASSSLRNKSNIVNANDDLVEIDLMMSLRRLRASALVASQGYHGPAFSLLRDIRDKSLLLSAYFQRKVSYGKLSGVDENFPSKGTKAEIRNRTRKVRVSSEKNIFEEMLDFNDITDETQRTDLGIWKDSFDRENHGSSISAASATKTWHLDRQPLYLVNIEDRSLMTQYINRFCDVAWMFHRLLPNLQLSAHKFDEKWKERWDILDHSFWMMENGLTEIGRPIGAAMIELVEKRFPFNANSFFDP